MKFSPTLFTYIKPEVELPYLAASYGCGLRGAGKNACIGIVSRIKSATMLILFLSNGSFALLESRYFDCFEDTPADGDTVARGRWRHVMQPLLPLTHLNPQANVESTDS